MGVRCAGIVHLPDFELIGVDEVEYRLLRLLDGVLQETDSFRRQNVNWKGFQLVESENSAVERDFGSHAGGVVNLFHAIGNHVTRVSPGRNLLFSVYSDCQPRGINEFRRERVLACIIVQTKYQQEASPKTRALSFG